MNIEYTLPFFSVSDMEKSLRFYVDGLGFEITHQWTPEGKIEWCALRREGGRLMLQEPRKASTPQTIRGAGVSIFFICNDALSIYHELIEKGIEASEPFVSNNMWLISLRDPDGYRIEFESSTDVPEETTYSEWIKANK